MNMTFDELKEKLQLIIDGDYRVGIPSRMKDIQIDYSFGYNNRQNGKIPEDYIAVAWKTAGAEGGSCWGDEPYPISPEDPIDLVPLLTMFFEDEVPQVTFLQYTKLCRECFEEYSHEEGGYYGNWYRYNGIALNVRKLYDMLVEMGHIKND